MDNEAFVQAIEDKVKAGLGRPVEPGEGERQNIDEGSPEDVVVDTPAQEPEVAAEEAADAAEAALPDDATQDEVDAAREQAAQEYYVSRYRTREEAEAAYAAKDSTIGRMGQKLGQLERELAEARERKPEEAAEQAPAEEELDVAAWSEWADHEITTGNAENAAIRALTEGGLDGYRVLINRWMGAVDEDGEPDFEARTRAQQFNAEVRLEMQRTAGQPTQPQPVVPAQAPPPEQPRPSTDGERIAAQHILEAQYPDWEQHKEGMASIVETLDPETQQFLRSQAQMGIAGRAKSLEYLYLAARQRKAEAQRVADARSDASGDAAIVAATVASAEATTSRTPQSEAESSKQSRRNELRKEWGLAPLSE